ncbi:MAG TPA: DUF6644 family protein [Ohtaekwangia sp.]|nr:DUF6644 family protein [Ohtaekwangia sp.]
METPDVFEWLESTQLAVSIRQSAVLFPVIEIVHIIGFIFLTGSAFLFDLRLLGFSKQISVTAMAHHILPWSRRSLLLVIPSGFLLFISQASVLSNNAVFVLKLILILVAIANAGIFHRYTFRSVNTWDRNIPTPFRAKAAAVVSLTVWMMVVSCGRMIAYFE